MEKMRLMPSQKKTRKMRMSSRGSLSSTTTVSKQVARHARKLDVKQLTYFATELRILALPAT
jgi:hypothetical protein